MIDGLTPAMLERAVESGRAPALARLVEHGTYGLGVSTFPSLTPVCLSSIATGAHPDVHHIPHLTWYDRAARRFVEYGSSFGALVAAGTRRSIIDTIFNMNGRHLAADAVTVYEALEDAGFVAAAVNVTCYRGRTPHRPTLPGIGRTASGPRRFFFYNLFESDETGAPLAVRNRAAGTVDGYAAAVARWLVTRDGFDFLLYYLSDYDFASHALGPEGAGHVLERTDAAVGALLEAAGGIDDFLERYAVVMCSDHGQTRVTEAARLEEAFDGLDVVRPGFPPRADVAVAASNRAAMVYRFGGCPEDERELALRLDGRPEVEVVLFREGEEAVARREREELRFAPANGGWRTSGDETILAFPNGLGRAWAALQNPNAGELLVSAREGFEFADLGGRHHAGGGSHGSLTLGDSQVPVVTVGVDAHAASITDLKPLVLAHFGVEAA